MAPRHRKKQQLAPLRDGFCIVRGCRNRATEHRCLCLGCYCYLVEGDPEKEPFAANSRAYELALETAEARLAEALHATLFGGVIP
jgi:hypothetical protein